MATRLLASRILSILLDRQTVSFPAMRRPRPSLVFFVSRFSQPLLLRDASGLNSRYSPTPLVSANPCPPALCRCLPPPHRTTPKRCTILVASGTGVGRAEPTVIWAEFRPAPTIRSFAERLFSSSLSHTHIINPHSDHGPCLSTPRSFTASTHASFLFFFPFRLFDKGQIKDRTGVGEEGSFGSAPLRPAPRARQFPLDICLFFLFGPRQQA